LCVHDCGNIKELFEQANKSGGNFVLGLSCGAPRCSGKQEDITMTLKNSVTTAALIAALAIPVAGFAQTTTAPSPSSPPAAAAPHSSAPAAAAPHAAAPATQASRHMRDDQMRASKLIGSAVYDSSDQKLGTIDELVLNPDGKVADVVIGVGGLLGAGEKHVAVPMADLKRGKSDHFVLNTTKDALKQMANFDLKAEGAARSGSSTHN
jgi:sporulation protein YlmC with PRC-barrel domain